jgi:hypothetical protein
VAGSGGSAETASTIDESAVAPSPKAHVPPFQVDEVEVAVNVQPDRLKVMGRARVGGVLSASVTFAIVFGPALITVLFTAGLCYLWQASGLVTALCTMLSGLTILVIGLVYTSNPRSPR